MTICYFGIYSPNHTRNRLNIKGLRANGVEVLECNVREKGFAKYWQLVKKHREISKRYQVMIVGFPGHPIMPLAWLLAKLNGKKIIFDAFISLYDSFVFDEKKYKPKSFQALKYWLVDWLACMLSDRVVLEVNEYAKYFIKTFKLNPKKFHRVLVSCDDEVMFPRENPEKSQRFTVHFHGTYIPAQGVEYIIDAARLLKEKEVYFNIIGRTKDYQPIIDQCNREGLTNITFYDFVPYERLAELISLADVCLGMFGNTEKAFASRKPLITGDTPAVREFLIDGENVLFCRVADSKDLSEKILILKNDLPLRQKISNNGHELYKQSMTPKKIGEELLTIARELNTN